jgi:hypothetical protein
MIVKLMKPKSVSECQSPARIAESGVGVLVNPRISPLLLQAHKVTATNKIQKIVQSVFFISISYSKKDDPNFSIKRVPLVKS